MTAIKYDSTTAVLSLLDQRLLPTETKYLEFRTAEEVRSRDNCCESQCP